jgi:predicted transposase/invertase (TIGR01784 family)
MKTGIVPTVDYVFKSVCGDEGQALVLVDLLNAVLGFPPGRTVTGVSLLNPSVPTELAGGKVPILDVRARDDPGRQFLLEMQQFVRPGFVKRALYYWAVAHAEQLLKGEHYETLQPTYAICFLNEALFDDVAYHHCFRVYDQEHGVLLCKDLEFHIVELSKFDLPAEAVQSPLERWCYFFRHGADLDAGALPASLDVPVIRKAMEVLVRISQSEIERQRYLEQQRIDRDAASLAADARMARQLGFDEGVAKGEVIGRIRLLQRLLKQPETASAELHQLPLEDLRQREAALEGELSGPKSANGAPPAGQT